MQLSVESPEIGRLFIGASRNLKSNFLCNHAAKNVKTTGAHTKSTGLILWALKQNIHLMT
jgi:hypothetical protein